ncbi:hypothetical protein JXL21_11455 [Candidatus Bathyarchaeota archaeon]|nr:hypothetical protein [Candidatus Bathyarchaeota archaeon]
MPEFVGPLREIRRSISQVAGAVASAAVMAGAESITDETATDEVAQYVKAAMKRMDGLLGAEASERIMVSCGRNCATVHSGPVDAAAARRGEHASFDEFLEAEELKPPRGMVVERSGEEVLFGYNPRHWRMRCLCGLVRGLPNGETMAESYCNCSKGFVEKYWETVYGGPVEVEIIETAISGSDVCRFKISFTG